MINPYPPSFKKFLWLLEIPLLAKAIPKISSPRFHEFPFIDNPPVKV
jgi:hypothetical protein